VLLHGCAALQRSAIRSVAGPLGERLNESLQREKDPDLVREGGPALILLLDGLAEGSSDPSLLLAAARARVAYAAGCFDRTQEDRARAMYDRARAQALKVLAARGVSTQIETPIAEFERQVRRLGAQDVPAMYVAAQAWMGWILSTGGSPEAMAQLERPLVLMRRVLELDPSYDRGGAHLFFGLYYTVQLPGAGRDLPTARRHFEEAIRLAGPGSLLPKVLFAEFYARYAQDRRLFDALVQEVLQSKQDAPGCELTNAIAQRRAATLKELAPEWFE
jgi:hypothetical protein